VSAALAALLTGEGDVPSWHGAASNRPPDRHVQELGACLDHLRQAGRTLAEEAGAVSDEALVLWQSEELASAGEPSHLPLLFAASGIARIILEIGEVSAARFRRNGDGHVSAGHGIPPQVDIDVLLADNRRRAAMANAPGQGMDGTRAAISALLPMIGNTVLIVAHELIGTAGRAGAGESSALAAVREAFHARIAPDDPNRIFIAELAAAAELVQSGAIVKAAGIAMPSVGDSTPRTRRGQGLAGIRPIA
jgi:histidine ammonia-lyase